MLHLYQQDKSHECSIDPYDYLLGRASKTNMADRELTEQQTPNRYMAVHLHPMTSSAIRRFSGLNVI